MSNKYYCIMSDACAIRRENCGTLKLSNTHHVSISDDGLQAVYATYMAEVLKTEQEQNNDV